MLTLIEEHGCYGGVQRIYQHESETIGLPMRLSVYLPPPAEGANAHKVPGLFYLAGLTCTEDTFPIKAGAQRFAAQHGIALISPGTSPCGAHVPGEADAWDFGVGAGFYVDATRDPWARNWRMYSYVRDGLRAEVTANLPVDGGRLGIFGHSTGGHGALVLALRNPEIYRSVSAFAPIAAPMRSPRGEKAFRGYLGDDREIWKRYDASELVTHASSRFDEGILVDQGLVDQLLRDQLSPEVF